MDGGMPAQATQFINSQNSQFKQSKSKTINIDQVDEPIKPRRDKEVKRGQDSTVKTGLFGMPSVGSGGPAPSSGGPGGLFGGISQNNKLFEGNQQSVSEKTHEK